jgi:hypothetical protein
MVPVKEDFDGYAPPTWVGPNVERLLDSLLPEHVIGLSSIFLTESANTARVRTHRKGGRTRIAGSDTRFCGRFCGRCYRSSGRCTPLSHAWHNVSGGEGWRGKHDDCQRRSIGVHISSSTISRSTRSTRIRCRARCRNRALRFCWAQGLRECWRRCGGASRSREGYNPIQLRRFRNARSSSRP